MRDGRIASDGAPDAFMRKAAPEAIYGFPEPLVQAARMRGMRCTVNNR